MTQPGFGQMRVSDAERERAAGVLKAAFSEGRLDQDEYIDRVGLVQTSKTYDDLAEQLHDLPVGPFAGLPLFPMAYPPYAPYPPQPAALTQPGALAQPGHPPVPYYPPGHGYPPVGPYQPPGRPQPQAGPNFAVASIAFGIISTLIFLAFLLPALARP